MSSADPLPLILLSGLAADASVFAPQKIAFTQLVVPSWPRPDPAESLDHYARRLARDLDVRGPCLIGGASFGGIVALHAAKHLDVKGVVLIGSIRSPAQLPMYARVARPLKRFVRVLPVGTLQWFVAPLSSPWFRRIAPFAWGLVGQFRRSDPEVFRWSLSRILDWRETPEPDCPVFQIHGDRDRTLPLRYTQPDTVVKGGGHVISLTHGREVNAFINSVLRSVGSG
ncbi:MAG: alpha/beta fold hydrolase [Rhodopirellula sp. JB044]|uniref:alpha/beta fold hydrolase n=1 Tax=Rhodopirellula sp. JB044 TaxID=3342844 RepID=UPI00370A41CD